MDHRSSPPRGLLGTLLRALSSPVVWASLATATPGLTLRAQDTGVGVVMGGTTAVVRVDAETAPRPTLRAFRIVAQITLDGLLDEPVWLRADSAYDFLQSIPRDGYPPTEQSVVRVMYDDANLYVGAVLYDSEPGKLAIPGLEQDFATQNSDIFGVAIDTYHDRQNAFLFAVNPRGALFDAQNFNDSRYTNRAWEGVVHVKAVIHDYGWTVEMAIPFTTLRFNPTDGDQSWGINFVRRVRRLNEDSYWAPLSRQHRVHKMSRAGTLEGLTGLRQGRNLSVKPYARAGRLAGAARDVDVSANDIAAGFDVKYGVTSRLTLDLTAFTDFSQVEVDQEQVNLTRFSLFFPEKRDFFLENDGIFSLGDQTVRNYRTGSSPRVFKLFHSRRIGLSGDRRPIDILGGVRLTGRVTNDLEVGVLGMQTRSMGDPIAGDFVPAENFAVVRVRKNLFGSSDVGAMVLNRQVTGGNTPDIYNRSFGFDGNFQLLRNMLVNTYFVRSDQSGLNGNTNAAWLQVAWRDPLWDVSGFVKHVGDAFNPGIGFVQRTNMRQAFATVGVHPQPNIPYVQEINPYLDVSYITDLQGVLESRWGTAGFGTRFLDGGLFRLEYTDNFERLRVETPIVGVPLPAGDYDFANLAATYVASGARWISGSVTVGHGSFYDGTRTFLGGSAVVRPNYHLQLDFSFQHNDLELLGRSVPADVLGGRARYGYSTKLFASAFVQYNNSTDEVVTNLRFNYLHAPLSDIFVVYTERRNVRLHTLVERVITVKATKLFAF